MKTRLLLTVGIVLFLVFLIALIPARVAVAWLAPPNIVLTGVNGTVWSGDAAQLGINGELVGRLRWSDGSLLLLIGRPAWQIEVDRNDGFLRGHVGASMGGRIRLTDLEGATSLPALRNIAPVGNAAGDVSIRLDELTAIDGLLEVIRGRIVIDGLRPPGLSEGTLGTLSTRFDGEDENPLLGIIEVEGGPISVRNATIRLEPDGSYEVSGRVSANADAPRDITQSLRFMGEEDAEGFREFSLAGSP